MPWGGRPFVVRVLSDEAGQFCLIATCKCGHKAEVDHWELAKRVGWEVELAILAKRFKCRRCGKRACELTASPLRKPKGYTGH